MRKILDILPEIIMSLVIIGMLLGFILMGVYTCYIDLTEISDTQYQELIEISKNYSKFPELEKAKYNGYISIAEYNRIIQQDEIHKQRQKLEKRFKNGV